MILSRRLFVNFIFLFALYIVNGQSSFSDEKVVFTAPVLAPIKNPRARVVETAKDFPVLRLISNNATRLNNSERNEQSRPIYVERLEDQTNKRSFSNYN
ncbi:unnamed protein product, partial [Brenthis ino]